MRQEFQTDFNVSRETMERLDIYSELLQKWNPAINLVSKTTLPLLWQRHFSDSAQIYNMRPQEPYHWVDLGSGGGFPGLVLTILAMEGKQLSRFTLVESDARKIAFLQTVARELGLNVKLIADRIELIDPLSADVISARALASLSKLLEYANDHLNAGGYAIFPKGNSFHSEIEDAKRFCRFDFEEVSSTTNPTGAILKIGDITRA